MSTVRVLAAVALLIGIGGAPTATCAAGCAAGYDFTPVAALIQDAVDTLPLDGASLLLIQNDQIIFEEASGEYTFGTAVLIASASKWLSATTIMTLVDDDLINLDAPISTYLPNFTGTKGTITTRQLLSHTSGLPSQHLCLAFRSISLEQCVNQIATTPLAAPPGAQFFYGEVSFQVAGRIAEVVTGQSWAELFAERIGGPLNMSHTTYGTSDNPLLGGGGTSTLYDYGNLVWMHLDAGTFSGERVLSPEAVLEMRRDQTAGATIAFSPYNDGRRYGLGNWRDRVDENDNPLQISSQGLFGFTPWLDLERNVAGVFLVQDRADRVNDLVAEMQGMIWDIIDAGPMCPPRLYLPIIGGD